MTRQKTRMDSNSPGIWDEIAGEKPFGLMGILNLTPDSFYDGGRLQSVQCALAHVEKLLNSGTDILDLGAESTRPGSASLPPHMEKNRLLPVFLAIRNEFPDAIISVDTWHAETARFFLANGAAIINDVSACFWDEALGEVLADAKPGYVLMHSQGRPSFMLLMKSELFFSWPWIAWLPSGCRKKILSWIQALALVKILPTTWRLWPIWMYFWNLAARSWPGFP